MGAETVREFSHDMDERSPQPCRTGEDCRFADRNAVATLASRKRWCAEAGDKRGIPFLGSAVHEQSRRGVWLDYVKVAECGQDAFSDDFPAGGPGQYTSRV